MEAIELKRRLDELYDNKYMYAPEIQRLQAQIMRDRMKGWLFESHHPLQDTVDRLKRACKEYDNHIMYYLKEAMRTHTVDASFLKEGDNVNG